MIKNITIGSDPEFFIVQGVKPISSIGIIEGDKYDPAALEEGFYVQKDNVLLEGNIPPSHTREEFIQNMLRWKELVSDILSIKGYTFISADSQEFQDEDLLDPGSREFGCAAYFNAWTMEIGNPSSLARMSTRVAG